jgi:uncharacterized protein
MDKTLERKLTALRKSIRKLDSALVAFSGGVDSTFLMRICREELGEKAVAVTALSDKYPSSELSLARRVARIIGARHLIVDPSALEEEPHNGSRSSNLYSSLKSMAMRLKLKAVLDGSHRDDMSDKGRNFLAARSAGVRSPLLESNLSKAEIRLLAKELGLPNWDKPASSRRARRASKKQAIPVRRVRVAKLYLDSLELKARLRAIGSKALIIVDKEGMVALARRFGAIRRKLRSLGFSEVMLKMS